MSSGLSMSMRVAFLLMISIGGGFGIGHLPRQYQLRAVLAAICLIVVLMTSGCMSIRPDKLLIGVDHTSHILQHFEREGWGDQTGCSGPMLGLRWQGEHYYLQASDMYCAQGRNDLQHEVANIQAGYAVSLK